MSLFDTGLSALQQLGFLQPNGTGMPAQPGQPGQPQQGQPAVQAPPQQNNNFLNNLAGQNSMAGNLTSMAQGGQGHGGILSNLLKLATMV